MIVNLSAALVIQNEIQMNEIHKVQNFDWNFDTRDSIIGAIISSYNNGRGQ